MKSLHQSWWTIKGDDESEVTIERGGNYTESSIHIMEEINIFEGDENSIIFQQVYAKKFECVYQLQLYPFDTQVDIKRFYKKISHNLMIF